MTDLPEPLDIAAIAPHPDDLEIVCGGTLAKLVRQGYRVGIFDLTSGEPTPRGSDETRRAEAEEARRILGVPVRVLVGLPNRVLMDDPQNRFKIATELRRYRPKVILTVAGRTPSASPDHHQAHLLTEASRFYSQLTKWDDRFDGTTPWRVPHMVYAPFPFDAEVRHWHSTFIVDIGDCIDQKVAAVKAYASQFDPDRFDRVEHMIRSASGWMGTQAGCTWGEMFALHHPVATGDLFQLVTGGKAVAPVEPGRGHLPMG